MLLIIVMCRCALRGAFLNYLQCFQNTIMNELVRAIATSKRGEASEGASPKDCLGHIPTEHFEEQQRWNATFSTFSYIYFLKKSALFKCKMAVFLFRMGLVPLLTLLSAPPVAMARGAWWGSVQIWWKRWKACATPSPCWPLSSRPLFLVYIYSGLPGFGGFVTHCQLNLVPDRSWFIVWIME